jgi:NarL family two-component system response regulator LiaR
MEPITVLIVDDHAVVRQGLQTFLESEDDIEVVGEAADGAEALQKVRDLVPDVVLMDLVMPGVDGATAIRQVGKISPNSQVLVLTSFSEDTRIFSAIKAGAMGYLLKDTPAEHLGIAIRCVARGELLLHPDIAKKVLAEFSALHPDAFSPGELTPREVEILTLIAKGKTNKAIARDLGISIKTVKTHVSNILSKLHMKDRTQAALYAVRHGLVPLPESTPDGPRIQS